MGIPITQTTYNWTHKFIIICNYILLGAASSCIFLTLSLRLYPSVVGLLFILLHVLTIAGAVSGCASSSDGGSSRRRWYALHIVATFLTAIFNGSVAVLLFSTIENFLGALGSYVREVDGVVILRLAGGLYVVMFCLEWVDRSFAFVVRYHGFVDGDNGGKEGDLKNLPWQEQV